MGVVPSPAKTPKPKPHIQWVNAIDVAKGNTKQGFITKSPCGCGSNLVAYSVDLLKQHRVSLPCCMCRGEIEPLKRYAGVIYACENIAWYTITGGNTRICFPNF